MVLRQWAEDSAILLPWLGVTVMRLTMSILFGVLVFPYVCLGRGESDSDSESFQKERLLTIEQAQSIRKEADSIDLGNRIYDEKFVQKLFDFYRYGVGTVDKPGNQVIVRKVCREWVLAIVRQLFYVGSQEAQRLTLEEFPVPDPGFIYPLEETSAERLRALVRDLLPTALDDLDLMQRLFLYSIAGRVFKANDAEAIARLKNLADKAGDSRESVLIEVIIERIRLSGVETVPEK